MSDIKKDYAMTRKARRTKRETALLRTKVISLHIANHSLSDADLGNNAGVATETASRWVDEYEKNRAEAAIIIENIAKSTLGLETLESRKSDSLDFHALSVWQIKEALQRAYDAGSGF